MVLFLTLVRNNILLMATYRVKIIARVRQFCRKLIKIKIISSICTDLHGEDGNPVIR